jgi:hypothetical protein
MTPAPFETALSPASFPGVSFDIWFFSYFVRCELDL